MSALLALAVVWLLGNAVLGASLVRRHVIATRREQIARRIHESFVHQSTYTPAQLEAALRKGK